VLVDIGQKGKEQSFQRGKARGLTFSSPAGLLFLFWVCLYLRHITFKTGIRTSQKTHHVSVTQPNQLMPFKEINAVYVRIISDNKYTLWAECGDFSLTSSYWIKNINKGGLSDPPSRQRGCYIRTLIASVRLENKNSGHGSHGAVTKTN
jgi:hypothetical protein